VASPQLWAWNYGRIEKIRANVDLMLPLFPFESEIYEREGVRSETIGHPLVHRLPRQLRREEPLPAARADARPVIALLPGSRRSEVSNLLGPMLDAVRLIQPRFPRARILLAGVEERLEPMIVETLARYSDLEVEYYLGRTLRIFEASDVVLIASGTATLEGAFFQKPMVMAYKVSWLNLLLISAVVRTRFIGIVNLLARRQTLIELLQNEANGENMARELIRILEDRPYREAMIAELDYVRRQLGRGNPAVRAAKAIVSLIEDLRRTRR
jgi:lipid-A-disaccharide synthase